MSVLELGGEGVAPTLAHRAAAQARGRGAGHCEQSAGPLAAATAADYTRNERWKRGKKGKVLEQSP